MGLRDRLRVEGRVADPEEGVPVSRVGVRRVDVVTAFGRVDFARSGWVLTLNMNSLDKWTHTVTALAFDSEGNATLLRGERSIQVVGPP